MAEEPMSSSYADGLSPYENKGKLGLKEIFDSEDEVRQKVAQLAECVRAAKHVVFHTGAGISTSAGIPDFRGPQGVWTLESQGLKPTVNISFNNAVPTKTHMALVKLIDKGLVHYVISQNIDGLHLRSGVSRTRMSELHGNMFTEQCSHCDRLFVRSSATTSVGQKCLERPCPLLRAGARPCRGKVHDTILDWEANLPERELCMAEWHSGLADLSVTLGTTLQILPSGNLPLQAKKRGGKVVICNLQATKHHKKGDLVIHAYVDDVMEQLMKLLSLDIPSYSSDTDPTVLARQRTVEWTISTKNMAVMRKLHSQLPKPVVIKRKKKPVSSEGSDKKIKTESNEEATVEGGADNKRNKAVSSEGSDKRKKPVSSEGVDKKIKTESSEEATVEGGTDNKRKKPVSSEGSDKKIKTESSEEAAVEGGADNKRKKPVSSEGVDKKIKTENSEQVTQSEMCESSSATVGQDLVDTANKNNKTERREETNQSEVSESGAATVSQDTEDKISDNNQLEANFTVQTDI